MSDFIQAMATGIGMPADLDIKNCINMPHVT